MITDKYLQLSFFSVAKFQLFDLFYWMALMSFIFPQEKSHVPSLHVKTKEKWETADYNDNVIGYCGVADNAEHWSNLL